MTQLATTTLRVRTFGYHASGWWSSPASMPLSIKEQVIALMFWNHCLRRCVRRGRRMVVVAGTGKTGRVNRVRLFREVA